LTRIKIDPVTRIEGHLRIEAEVSSRLDPMDPEQITEQIARSWYGYTNGDAAALHPYNGETTAEYTGPKTPYQWLQTDEKYSWLKAPRYDGEVMEVGPLARVLVASAAGSAEIATPVDRALHTLGLGQDALYSSIGRILTGPSSQRSSSSGCRPGSTPCRRTWIPVTCGSPTPPSGTRRRGPRVPAGSVPTRCLAGRLGHWVEISGGLIEHYQAVMPTTWNASPRDAQGQPGPYEQALVGTPVADPTRPLELLRTVHSFDPCLACAVHVLDAEDGGQRTTVSVDTG